MCRRLRLEEGFVLFFAAPAAAAAAVASSPGKDLERAARYLPRAATRAGEGARFFRIHRLHF